MDYNYQQQPVPQFRKKFNVFGLISALIYLVGCFLPCVNLGDEIGEMMQNPLFRDQLRTYGFTKQRYNFWELGNIADNYSDKGIEYKAYFLGLVVIGVFMLLFVLLKTKVPVIVFSSLGLAAASYAILWNIGFSTVSELNYNTISYGVYIMIIGAILSIIAGAVYRTRPAYNPAAGYANSYTNNGYGQQSFVAQSVQPQYQGQTYQAQGQPYQAQGQPYQAQGQTYQAQGQPYQAQGQPYQAQGQPYQAQEQPYQAPEQPYQAPEQSQQTTPGEF